MKKFGKLLAFAFTFVVISCISTWNVSAQELRINADMSQEEIDAVVQLLQAGDVLVVDAGNYATKKDNLNFHKSVIVSSKEVTVKLNGTYERFQLITKNEGIIHLTLDGDVEMNGNASTVFNPSAALAIQSGKVDVDTKGYTLTIDDYNNAVRLGNQIAGQSSKSGNFTLLNGAKVVLKNSSNLDGVTKDTAYYDSYNDHGDEGVAYGWRDNGSYYEDGNTGAGIYTRGQGATHTIRLEKNSSLLITENDNAGIYVGYYNPKANTVNINLGSATLKSDDNTGSGLFEDGTGTGNYHIVANNSKLSFSNNKSRGMVGHAISSITLNNSTLHVDNNRSLGINNAFIRLTNSTLTGNNNNGHGISNVSLDATNSIVEANNNTYMGLNISKYNKGEVATNISSTKITTNGNGGPGIRFFATREENLLTKADTIITDGSIITAKGNGIGTSIYGYQINPGDSGYWADIVTRGKLYSKESSMFVGTYSVYDVGKLYLQSILYVDKDMVITTLKNDEFETAMDIYNDKASTVDGRVYVVGGSLQGNLFDMTEGSTYVFNGKVQGDYAGPVNLDGTKLVRFDLNREINKEVNGNKTNTFTYYDPFTKAEYIYQFRYNEKGEDLISGEFDNAYVWTPASIVNYDSTEGIIDYTSSTSGKYVNGSSVTDKTQNGEADRFTEDITVFGNSLDLAEKVMPVAKRQGYRFLGWFTPDYENTELAKKYASDGNFEELYKLLVNPFTSSTKVLSDTNDLTSGLEEITIYAKWEKIKGKVIAHYVDEEGNTLHEDITTEDAVGENYTTSQLEIKDYEFIRVEGNTTGKYIDGTIEVTYVYTKAKGNVIAHYVDEEGNTLHADIETNGKVGEAYETSALDIPNYVLLKVEGETTGKYINGTIEVTYIYTNKTGDTEGPEELPEGPVEPPHTGVEVVNNVSMAFVPHQHLYIKRRRYN